MTLKDLILWRLLPLLGLGAGGLYLMLPRGGTAGQRFYRYVGGGILTFVLVQLATLPLPALQAGGTARTILESTIGSRTFSGTFLALAAISLASAVMMITSRNPVYSALWFAMVLLANSGLYLLAGAEFLAAATMIIYAGAIIVTFLFVIMLAQPMGTASYDRYSREPFLACVTGAGLAAILAGAVFYSSVSEKETLAVATRDTTVAAVKTTRPGPAAAGVVADRVEVKTKDLPRWAIDEEKKFSHVKGLGVTLMRDHYISIEVIGVLLLVAVAGAVLIAAHRLEPKR